MKNDESKVLVGLVCYKPEYNLLNEIVLGFKRQGCVVYLFFNSPFSINDFNTVEKVLGDGSNKGIAYAHQMLINEAQKDEFDYIVLSDQDSIYPSDYVGNMLVFFSDFPDTRISCPAWSDLNSSSNIAVKQFCLDDNKMYFTNPINGQKLAHAISSGMFISLKNVGNVPLSFFIDSDLFIDWVDNDFCWSLVSSGEVIRFNSNVILNHHLGDKTKSYLNTKYTIRSPLRDYYILRNAVFLLLYRDYSINCKAYLFRKVFKHFFVSISSSGIRNFYSRFLLSIRAIYDGFRRNMGKLN